MNLYQLESAIISNDKFAVELCRRLKKLEKTLKNFSGSGICNFIPLNTPIRQTPFDIIGFLELKNNDAILYSDILGPGMYINHIMLNGECNYKYGSSTLSYTFVVLPSMIKNIRTSINVANHSYDPLFIQSYNTTSPIIFKNMTHLIGNQIFLASEKDNVISFLSDPTFKIEVPGSPGELFSESDDTAGLLESMENAFGNDYKFDPGAADAFKQIPDLIIPVVTTNEGYFGPGTFQPYRNGMGG